MRTDYLNLMDAAAQLGMSYGRALRLVLIGALQGQKQSGHWVVSIDDLNRLISTLDKDVG